MTSGSCVTEGAKDSAGLSRLSRSQLFLRHRARPGSRAWVSLGESPQSVPQAFWVWRVMLLCCEDSRLLFLNSLYVFASIDETAATSTTPASSFSWRWLWHTGQAGRAGQKWDRASRKVCVGGGLSPRMAAREDSMGWLAERDSFQSGTWPACGPGNSATDGEFSIPLGNAPLSLTGVWNSLRKNVRLQVRAECGLVRWGSGAVAGRSLERPGGAAGGSLPEVYPSQNSGFPGSELRGQPSRCQRAVTRGDVTGSRARWQQAMPGAL